MVSYLVGNLTLVIGALGGWVFTVSVAVAFGTYFVITRTARTSAQRARYSHEEKVTAEANRHVERVALIQSNDPKVIEGLNKRMQIDNG